MAAMSQEKMQRLGARVRARRDAIGLSRKDVEQQYGIAQQTLQALEDGRYNDIQLFGLLPILAAVGLAFDDISDGLDANYDRVLSDRFRHSVDGKMAPSKEAADVFPATQARVRELEAENAVLREQLDATERVITAVKTLAVNALGETPGAPARSSTRSRRRPRSHG
jgi:transcriptional regulator with XRE-family HTH domain